MNEGIHLDLDTWIVPGQIRKANLCRGLGNRYTPAGFFIPPFFRNNYSMFLKRNIFPEKNHWWRAEGYSPRISSDAVSNVKFDSVIMSAKLGVHTLVSP